MNTYRCTRQAPYPEGTQAHIDPTQRQGYFPVVANEKEALDWMKKLFPEETIFTVELWSSERTGIHPLVYDGETVDTSRVNKG
jgi:hypothetical protein